MHTNMEQWRYSTMLFNLSTRLRWVTASQPAAISLRKEFQYPQNRRLGDLREKYPALLGIEPSHPTCSLVTELTELFNFPINPLKSKLILIIFKNSVHKTAKGRTPPRRWTYSRRSFTQNVQDLTCSGLTKFPEFRYLSSRRAQ
jgi:hypothetical protein